jgi:class 3 adenylate cyclase
VELLGGRYEVLREVSVGRRATVLQALDRQHGKPVALKVYTISNDVDRDELLTEARILLSIRSHPSLPVVRNDFFTDDDRYVMVLNWIDGIDLARELEEHGDPGMPLSQVIDDAAQVAAALDHLHGHAPPVVHGDVKPANAIRTPDGTIVLVDFDIASAQADRAPSGTVGFVAPEVVAGEKPTPAADVYGLAATIVTLWTGSPPTSVRPEWSGAVANVLQLALSVDPAMRPPSAGRLVERLRRASVADLPRGVVTMLSVEIVDRDQLWDDDPEAMSSAMVRLRDLLGGAAENNGGRVLESVKDGTLAVFREASGAARTALYFRERLLQPALSIGLDLRVRIALEVGEADVIDGVYVGRAVERVLWLRSIAAPGSIVTTQSSADVIGDTASGDVAIVPLGAVETRDRPRGIEVCALTPPGEEHTARLEVEVVDDIPIVAPAAPVNDTAPRRLALSEAMEHPATLTAVTVAGLALIYLLLVAPQLGGSALALVILIVSAVAAVACFAWRYSIGYGEAEAQREVERLEREEAEATRRRIAEIAQRRRELAAGMARAGSDEGSRVLAGLTNEFEAISHSLRESGADSALSFVHILPGLAEETYMTGLSVLAQALGLLEVSESSRRRRIELELLDIKERLDDPSRTDERERARDERRKESHEQTLAALDDARNGAGDLLAEAERCENTLYRTRVELAALRAGRATVSVDSVIETLQDNIRRVREVQDELRRLQY